MVWFWNADGRRKWTKSAEEPYRRNNAGFQPPSARETRNARAGAAAPGQVRAAESVEGAHAEGRQGGAAQGEEGEP